FKRALEQLEGAPLIVYRRHSTCLRDRKSTRLNSSHVSTSYAVFCLKKKRSFLEPFGKGSTLEFAETRDAKPSGPVMPGTAGMSIRSASGRDRAERGLYALAVKKQDP